MHGAAGRIEVASAGGCVTATLVWQAARNRAVAIFLDEPPPADALAAIRHRKEEDIVLGTREIYVHYGDGMADSKLVIPAARAGTARNLNTIAKLVEMARAVA